MIAAVFEERHLEWLPVSRRMQIHLALRMRSAADEFAALLWVRNQQRSR
jgi:hypothetical protein